MTCHVYRLPKIGASEVALEVPFILAKASECEATLLGEVVSMQKFAIQSCGASQGNKSIPGRGVLKQKNKMAISF